MARTFTAASSHLIQTTIGGNNFVSPITIAAIVKRGSDGVDQCIYRAGSGAGAAWAFFARTTNKVVIWNQTTQQGPSVMTLLAADGWCLMAVSKTAGTTTARFHKYVFSTNTWTHEDATTTIADPTTPASNCWLGSQGASTYWNGDIEIIGTWNVAMTDAQTESLAFNLASWYAPAAPKGLWPLYQQATSQKVLDISGNGANESSITGTAVSTSSVPVFSYGLHVGSATRQPAAAGGGVSGPRDLLLMGAG